MKPRSILYWEAKRRLNLLIAYRQKISDYYAKAEWGDSSGSWDDTEETSEIRREINEHMRDVAIAIGFVGISVEIYYAPPPAVGGIAADISLLDNVFVLPRYQIPHTELLDLLDRVIGIYKSWVGPLWRKLFNPFYWLGWGLTLIAEAPFRILDAAGFNGTKAEGSMWGRMIKAVIQFVTVIGGGIISLLTILDKLDLLEATKVVIHKFLGV